MRGRTKGYRLFRSEAGAVTPRVGGVPDGLWSIVYSPVLLMKAGSLWQGRAGSPSTPCIHRERIESGRERFSLEFLISRFKPVRNGELGHSSFPLDHSRRSRTAGCVLHSICQSEASPLQNRERAGTEPRIGGLSEEYRVGFSEDAFES